MEESKENVGTILNFCPKCDTLLKFFYEEGKPLMMRCYNCTFTMDAPDKITIIRNRDDVKINTMNQDMIHDSSLINTKRLRCTCMSCPTADVNTWDKYDPYLKMVSYFDQDRKMNLICPHCNTIYSLKVETPDKLELEDSSS